MTAVARLPPASAGAGELAATRNSHGVCEVVLFTEEEAASIGRIYGLPMWEARRGEDPTRTASPRTAVVVASAAAVPTAAACSCPLNMGMKKKKKEKKNLITIYFFIPNKMYEIYK